MKTSREIDAIARNLIDETAGSKERMKDVPQEDRIAVSRALDGIAQQAAWASARLSWLATNRQDEEGADEYARRRNKAVRKALGYLSL